MIPGGFSAAISVSQADVRRGTEVYFLRPAALDYACWCLTGNMSVSCFYITSLTIFLAFFSIKYTGLICFFEY